MTIQGHARPLKHSTINLTLRFTFSFSTNDSDTQQQRDMPTVYSAL